MKAADDNGYVSCVSCGITKLYNDGMQGGHFINKGSSSRWALDERNVHPQCAGCNLFKMNGGVANISYTYFMTDMYGREFVEQMKDTASQPVKLSTQDYRDMVADLKAQIKEQEARIG